MNQPKERKEDLWGYLASAGRPVVLYGTGNGADKILDQLILRNIPVSGVFASSGFVRDRSFRGFPVETYDALKERFPDMIEPYDKRLIKLADEIALEKGIWVQHGVYCSTSGPTYETPAECRYFRIIGADTIGMSTTPEVIVARQGKLPVFGLSIVSDMGNIYGVDHVSTITHEEVIKAVNAVEPKLITLITELIRRSSEIQF